MEAEGIEYDHTTRMAHIHIAHVSTYDQCSSTRSIAVWSKQTASAQANKRGGKVCFISSPRQRLVSIPPSLGEPRLESQSTVWPYRYEPAAPLLVRLAALLSSQRGCSSRSSRDGLFAPQVMCRMVLVAARLVVPRSVDDDDGSLGW